MSDADDKARVARSAKKIHGVLDAHGRRMFADVGSAGAGEVVGRRRAPRDYSRDPAPAIITDPASNLTRYIPDVNLLRENCEKLVMTGEGYWRDWAARQLYAMGCAPKMLAAAKYDRGDLVSRSWLNPNCEIELRVDETRPPDAAARAFVYPDGERFEDIRDACQMAWLAHNIDAVVEIAQRYGLYWEALLSYSEVRP